MMIKFLLEKSGYQVLTAETGAAAIQLLKQKNAPIDLLLTDINLTGDMNGPALAKKLRTNQPDLKAIFITGYDIDTVAADLPPEDKSHLVQKPFDPFFLQQTVRKILEEK